jgi:Undecaprenyl-phosphate glucose phosphotransferase
MSSEQHDSRHVSKRAIAKTVVKEAYDSETEFSPEDVCQDHESPEAAHEESRRQPALALTDPFILAAIMIVDVVVVFGGSIAGWMVYHEVSGMAFPDWQLYVLAGLILSSMFFLRGLDTTIYGNVWGVDRRQALIKTSTDFMQAFLLFVTFLVMTRWAVTYSRGSLVVQFLICGGAIMMVRALELELLRDHRVKRFIASNRTILIGSSEEIQRTKTIWRDSHENVLVVKSFPVQLDLSMGDELSEYLADFADAVIKKSRESRPDRIVILLPFEHTREICFLVERLSALPSSILVSTESLTSSRVKREALTVGGLRMLRVVRKPLTAKDRVIKRTLDMIASFVLLLLLLPVLALVAIAIKIDSPGPVLFRQKRKGFNQHQFSIFKFRTMRVASPDEVFRQTGKNDNRITRLGKFLRRCNIDELPQLLNVLRGEMSLVGPRPHAIEHDNMYTTKIASYARRHNIKPGITGLAQVHGCRGATETMQQMEDRVNFDLTYIQNWSIFLDIKVLLMTVFSRGAYKNAY